MMRAAFFKGIRSGADGELDRLIRELTDGPYSHSCLLFSDGMMGEATNKHGGGVRFVPAKPMPAASWDFVDLPEPEYNERLAKQWFSDHRGEAYDYDGALRMMDLKLKQDPGAWYCSEAVLAALGIGDPRPERSTSNTVYDYLTTGDAP